MNKLAGNFLICWLGWGIPMGLLFSVMFASLQKGMLSGIAGGLLFAVIMILFTAVLSSRKDKLRERYGIEGTILRDGAANHMVGKEAVGGWIFLTEDRFFFASHAINRTTGAWSVLYADIENVTEGKWIRSLAIRTKDGTEDEFIVNDRREWIAFLKEKCGM